MNVQYVEAQNTSKEIMKKPIKYLLPYDQNDVSPTNEVVPNSLWVVFSDKENNKTYTEPGGYGEFKTLSFLEKLYVAEENGEFARLVKPDIESFDSTPQVIDYGWINKKNLLLWTHCLVTEEGRINRKAMILNTIEHLKKGFLTGEPNTVKFRKGEESSSSYSGKQSQLYQIFYIYKIKNDMALLGKQERLDPKNENLLRNNIVGWAPISRITIWDHRIAIEPNWESQAVSERKNGLKARFFSDINSSYNYREGEIPQAEKIIWDSDPLGERPIGEWRRFPLIKTNNNETIITAGIMGEIYSSDGKMVSSESVATLQRKLDDSRAKRRFINIVFVVDGTQSMEPYFKEISNAIMETMPKLIKEGTQNHFKFGAAVYRDWPEGRERLLKIERLTSDYSNIASFFENYQAGDIKDKTQPEAVFYGLKGALRQVGLPDDETNVIALIGDAGNHKRNDPSQVDATEIVELLVAKNCHFLAFQVHHEPHPAYNEFINQTKLLIKNFSESTYFQYSQLANEFGEIVDPPEWQKSGNTYKLKNGASVGWMLGLSIGQVMNPATLKTEISNFLVAIDEINNRFISSIQAIIEGSSLSQSIGDANHGYSKSRYVNSFAPGIIQFLNNHGINDEELNIIKSRNYQIYTVGTSPLYVNQQKQPIFKQVLLLSRIELHQLWDSINRLIVAGSMDEQRRRMSHVWKELLKEHTGEMSNEEMENLSMEEIYEKVFGLPSTSDMLRNIKLRDILDRGKFSDEDFAMYLVRIKNKDKELFKIINMDNHEYSFRSNEQVYYWIPQDILP